MSNVSKIFITISPNKDKPVEVKLSRTLLIKKLVKNQLPAKAISTIALLFNQCSATQRIAGLTAIEAALQLPTTKKLKKYRGFIVQLECLHDSLWLILIDLPKMLGMEPNWEYFKALSALLLSYIDEVSQSNMFTLARSDTVDNINYKHLIEMEYLDLAKGLYEQCKETRALLISSQLFSEIATELSYYDWLTKRKNNALNDEAVRMVGATRRYQHILAKSDFRLSSLFTILKADIFNQLNDVISELSTAIAHDTLPKMSSKSEIGKIDCSYLRQQNKALQKSDLPLSAIVKIETARGTLQHEVSLQANEKQIFVEKWQIKSPSEINLSSNGCANLWLKELTQNFNYSKDELIKRANLLIKLVNPCCKVELNYLSNFETIEKKNYT